MARFTYKCKEHGEFTVSLNKRSPKYACPTCGTESYPSVKAATISVVEKLDNGAMSRAVERLHNVEEIMNDRSDKHSKEMGFGDEEND